MIDRFYLDFTVTEDNGSYLEWWISQKRQAETDVEYIRADLVPDLELMADRLFKFFYLGDMRATQGTRTQIIEHILSILRGEP